MVEETERIRKILFITIDLQWALCFALDKTTDRLY